MSLFNGFVAKVSVTHYFLENYSLSFGRKILQFSS